MLDCFRRTVERSPVGCSRNRGGGVFSRHAPKQGWVPSVSAQGSVRPCQPALVSIPASVHGAPSVEDLVASKAKLFLDEVEGMIRSAEDASKLYEVHGPIWPYPDPVLSNYRFRHLGLMKSLHRSGRQSNVHDPASTLECCRVQSGEKGHQTHPGQASCRARVQVCSVCVCAHVRRLDDCVSVAHCP